LVVAAAAAAIAFVSVGDGSADVAVDLLLRKVRVLDLGDPLFGLEEDLDRAASTKRPVELTAHRATGPQQPLSKLLSYPPALRRVLPNVDHRRHKGLNNRAENSHPADAAA